MRDTSRLAPGLFLQADDAHSHGTFDAFAEGRGFDDDGIEQVGIFFHLDFDEGSRCRYNVFGGKHRQVADARSLQAVDARRHLFDAEHAE